MANTKRNATAAPAAPATAAPAAPATAAPAAPVPPTFTGKYTKAVGALLGGNPHVCPASYVHYNHTFSLGVNPPKNTPVWAALANGTFTGRTTVFAIIAAYVVAHKGCTGAQVVNAMVNYGHLFAQHTKANIVYAQGGKVCSLWVIGYLKGALLPRHAHLKVTAPTA